MGNNLHNNYLYRALEAYPWELEKVMEALNYALSYEPENVNALYLMAKVQSEQLGENELAKAYYEKALSARIDFPNIYPDYIRFLVNNGDFDEAKKLIDYAKTVKGIDKAGIYLTEGYLYEAQLDFDKAEAALKEAKMYGLNNEFLDYVNTVLSRVVKKRKTLKNEERKVENIKKNEVKEPDKHWFLNRLNNLL